MIIDFKKLDHENDWEYGLRLIESKVTGDVDCDWQDIVEHLGLDCHRDSLRKATNTTQYSGLEVAKYFKQKMESMAVNTIQDYGMDELLEELEFKKIELQKERVKLQDQRRQFHSLVRTEARWEALLDLIKYEIEKLPNVKWQEKNISPSLDFEANEASLLLSDWHIGTDINTMHNQFNIDIAKDRIQQLKSDTLKYCKMHNVQTLHVNIAGDMISGVIHVTTRILNQENAVSQVMTCSELLSQLICELANHIPNIKINYTIGNHGRISANIKESLDSENFEYLILEFLKLRLKDVSNVVFNESKIDKEITVYEVLGQTIALVHGHREKKPYESTKELSAFLGKKIDIVMMGHFHNFSVKNNVIVNGCLSGSDEYANNLRFNNEPSQILVVHLGDGNKALYEIILK